jgi:DNA-binding HxlR family transcriptional regulator
VEVAGGEADRQEATGADGALRDAVELVGDRWVLLIVDALLGGPQRFGDLAAALGVAPNILIGRLRQLERHGVVVGRPYQQRPVRLEYQLTATGRDLGAALARLAEWGARRRGGDGGRFHATCGTALEERPWCPTCGRAVEPDDDTDQYEV